MARQAPGIAEQWAMIRRSSMSWPYGSASLTETVLMPRKKKQVMQMATQARVWTAGLREPSRASTKAKTGR